MKYKCGIFIIITLILLSGCETTKYIDNAALQSQVRVITDYRDTPAVPWSSDEITAFESYCLPFSTEIQNWEQLVCAPSIPQTSLTYLEAYKEVQLLFQILKEAYSGYDYFGGDTAFSGAQQRIQDLVSKDCRFDHTISRIKLRTYFRKELDPLIDDGHFQIDDRNLELNFYQMYYVPGIYLDSLESVAPEMREYVRPVLSRDGDLKLGFVVCDTSSDDLPTTAMVDNQTVQLSWIMATPYDYKENVLDTPFTVKTVYQIPVLIMRSFDPTILTEEYLNKMMDTAIQYREMPVIILDIRSNTGGNTDIPASWLQQFLDSATAIEGKTIAGVKGSGLWVHEADSYYGEEMSERAQEYYGSWNVNIPSYTTAKNDHLIFVLVDERTASAAEVFVNYLRSIPNVVIVGSNTSGAKIFGNVRTVYLPYSGIKVRFGTSLTFRETLENTEGLGITPDLWVPPEYSLESVTSFINTYRQ